MTKILDMIQESINEDKMLCPELFENNGLIMNLHETASRVGVPEELFTEFSEKSKHAVYLDNAFPFFLEKSEEKNKCSSEIKIYPIKRIALLEWRRFEVIDGQLKSVEAFRQFVSISDLNSYLKKGYVWTYKPKLPLVFYLDRALKGDMTSFGLKGLNDK